MRTFSTSGREFDSIAERCAGCIEALASSDDSETKIIATSGALRRAPFQLLKELAKVVSPTSGAGVELAELIEELLANPEPLSEISALLTGAGAPLQRDRAPSPAQPSVPNTGSRIK